jgi:NhaA family Na+:H+ antiporter
VRAVRHRPQAEGRDLLQIYAVAALCGNRLHDELFIGALAFPGNAELIEEAKIGVLLGSPPRRSRASSSCASPRPAPTTASRKWSRVEIDADGDVERVEERKA